MTLDETSALLALVTAYDPRQSSSETSAHAWHLVLRDLPFDAAKTAVNVHYGAPTKRGEFFGVGDIASNARRIARMDPDQIEADVRSAKARGIIGSDWPAQMLLPNREREQLAAAREVDRLRNEVIELEPGDKPIPQAMLEATVKRIPQDPW